MGNVFSSSQEKEFKRLCKRNTRVNRERFASADFTSSNSFNANDLTGSPRRSMKRNCSFGNLVTEVRYDSELPAHFETDGAVDVVHEDLVYPDEQQEELLADVVPTTIPIAPLKDLSLPTSHVPARDMLRNGSFSGSRSILRKGSLPLELEVQNLHLQAFANSEDDAEDDVGKEDASGHGEDVHYKL
mmetsp:Transcript_19565/g.44760  ORF Transcript_19565/g.44760 Transcript_19565/m.44760 type:complete len:187 (-) Transcript_19565:953-1513(-)|eukprot:760642-Hanusia_phi.AAC.2